MRTAWHALLVLMLEHLLAAERWRLSPEVQLTGESQRLARYEMAAVAELAAGE